MLCKLISQNKAIPSQQVFENKPLLIGRNKECKIKHLKCSRNHCLVQLKDRKLQISYLKSKKNETISSGQLFEGPGFCYKVRIFDDQGESISGSQVGRVSGAVLGGPVVHYNLFGFFIE